MAAKKTAATKAAAKGNGGAAKKTASNKGGGGKAAGGKAAGIGKEKSLTELVAALAEKTGITRAQAKEVLEVHARLLIDELNQNGSVQLIGIGKLKMGERAERQGRNPATGEAITIKAGKTVRFSGGKRFKESFE